MKARLPLLNNPLQLALQLDLFSDSSATEPKTEVRQPPKTPVIDKIEKGAPPAQPRPTSSNGKRQILIQDYWLEYSLLRSKRRTIGFLINEDGLKITAPRWVTIADIELAIREKQRWITTKLNELRDRIKRRMQPDMHWGDGAKLPYLGGEVTLRILSTQTAGIRFDEASRDLIVCLPAGAGEQQLKDRVQSWLQQEAKRVFTERLPLYAEKLGVTYHSMALSGATTRWGSCTSQGKIRLNWRLIHFSLQLIDYVVAHELAHLREMNHSPRFWATVQSVFPEFEQAKKALREHAAQELPIF